MKVNSVKLLFFSPTGTTKAVIHGIAAGFGEHPTTIYNISKPQARIQKLKINSDELLVVGVPVYMGRVPAIIMDWLQSIVADKTPVVCVVVYGNRVFDDALLELKNVLVKCGCIPIAAGAYIGEHSFSNNERPIAEGRPDMNDLHHAHLFGIEIYKKLLSISSINQLSDLNIPGNNPYGGITQLWNVDFIEIGNNCSQCGICANNCPAGAMDKETLDFVNIEKCITCCACIKNCPTNNRKMKVGLVKDASIRLNNLYKEHKEPMVFL